jgi:hypothetical protein
VEAFACYTYRRWAGLGKGRLFPPTLPIISIVYVIWTNSHQWCNGLLGHVWVDMLQVRFLEPPS